ncbi:MAG: adenylate/guanylate cyclase domain-containing protein, partial [Acidimicrobiia bacterium]|nr:adenylate/guanylate cyclase domain-containing protein [Acidimicrobiia bacterium]
LDLQAVIERVGVETVDLFAAIHSGPVAIEYAARNPERVRALILFCSYADGAQFGEGTLTTATRPLINQDWSFYSQVVARLLLGWTDADAAAAFAELVAECTSPEMASLTLEATKQFDVRESLANVDCPVLVFHRRQLQIAPFQMSQDLAAGLPNANLSLVEGASVAPYVGDFEDIVRRINDFVGLDVGSADEAQGHREVQTILFTDVEGSTSMTSQLGDAAGREILRHHEEVVRSSLQRHRGTEIKSMGDGFMASFTSAAAAVEAAIDIQHSLSRSSMEGRNVRVRMGLDAGEPIAEGGDLFGTVVNSAARIAAKASGSEILVADVVRQLVRGKGFRFEELGPTHLRGIEGQVLIHRLVWEGPDV